MGCNKGEPKGDAGLMKKTFCLLIEFVVTQIYMYFKFHRNVLPKKGEFYYMLIKKRKKRWKQPAKCPIQGLSK